MVDLKVPKSKNVVNTRVKTESPSPKDTSKRKNKPAESHKESNKKLTRKPNRIQEFIAETSLYILRFWLGSKKLFPVRLFYFLLHISLSCLTGYIIYQNRNFYLETDKSTHVSSSVESNITFPAVTICPTNSWRFSKFSGTPLVLQSDMLSNLPRKTNLTDACYDSSRPNLFKTQAEWNQFWRNHSQRQGLDHFLIPFEDTFLECQTKTTTSNCSQLFFGRLMADNERCYTFNYGGGTEHYAAKDSLVWTYSLRPFKLMFVQESGPWNGLKVSLNVNEHEMCEKVSTSRSGFRVVVHDPSILPLYTDESRLISPGHYSEIGVKKVVVHRAGCTPPEPTSASLFPASEYSRENCIFQCVAEAVWTVCRCLLQHYPFAHSDMRNTLQEIIPVKDKNRTTCVHSGLQCQNRVILDYKLGPDTYKCRSTCPQSCREALYEATISSSRLRTSAGVSSEERAVVKVYVQSMRVSTQREHASSSFFHFLGVVGGTAAFFLGTTLLTCFETLELFSYLLLDFLSYKKTQ